MRPLWKRWPGMSQNPQPVHSREEIVRTGVTRSGFVWVLFVNGILKPDECLMVLPQ